MEQELEKAKLEWQQQKKKERVLVSFELVLPCCLDCLLKVFSFLCLEQRKTYSMQKKTMMMQKRKKMMRMQIKCPWMLPLSPRLASIATSPVKALQKNLEEEQKRERHWLLLHPVYARHVNVVHEYFLVQIVAHSPPEDKCKAFCLPCACEDEI